MKMRKQTFRFRNNIDTLINGNGPTSLLSFPTGKYYTHKKKPEVGVVFEDSRGRKYMRDKKTGSVRRVEG